MALSILTVGLAAAVVNEALAERYLQGTEAVGRRIWWPAENPEEVRAFEIVGVVRNIRPADLVAEPEPMVYFSYPQIGYSPGTSLLVSTTTDSAISIPMLYRWLLDLEPHMAIVSAVPYSEVLHGLRYVQRRNAEMFTALALLGLALATAGSFVLIRTLTPVALGVVVGLAAYYPTHKATTLNPATALR